jgi:type II secretory pathway pseudopilin PulG
MRPRYTLIDILITVMCLGLLASTLATSALHCIA